MIKTEFRQKDQKQLFSLFSLYQGILQQILILRLIKQSIKIILYLS